MPQNKMDIASILQSSFVSHADSPLFIEQSSESRIITYAQALSCIKLYQDWTTHLVRESLANNTTHPSDLENQQYDSSFDSNISPTFAFLGNNSPDYLLAVLACINLGLPTSLLNIRWTPSEIANTLRVQCKCSQCSPWLRNSKPITKATVTVIIYTGDYQHVAQQARIQLTSFPCRKHKVFLQPLAVFSHILSSTESFPNKSSVALLDFRLIPHDQVTDRDAIILFTSGTTSTSKGCCLSHRSLFIQACAKTYHPCYYDKDSRLYATPLPLFHIGGFSSALAILLVGGSLVFSSSGTQSNSFDPFKMISLLSSVDNDHAQSHMVATVNTLVVVPTILYSLFSCLQDSVHQFTNVQMILVGAQSLTENQLEKCRTFFPNARIVQTYACTEAGSSITFVDLTRVQTLSKGLNGGSFVGYPPAHIEIQILQTDKRKEGPIALLPFHLGLISTKGPHVMNKYWCREDLPSPEANDGWLVTNDLGYITDQGGLFYCGRLDDVIRTGGESVLAMEVEMVLMQHPMIDTVSVFPLVDEKFGHIVCAAIKPTQAKYFAAASSPISNVGVMVSSGFDEIRGFCTKHQLAKYKHPKKIYILRDFPRNSSGKILKHELTKICSALDTASNGTRPSKL